MINSIVTALYKRKVELAVDIDFIYKYRQFSDGITFLNLLINLDIYLEDHNPKFEIQLVICNWVIFSLNIYNKLHIEAQQIIDPSILTK